MPAVVAHSTTCSMINAHAAAAAEAEPETTTEEGERQREKLPKKGAIVRLLLCLVCIKTWPRYDFYSCMSSKLSVSFLFGLVSSRLVVDCPSYSSWLSVSMVYRANFQSI